MWPPPGLRSPRSKDPAVRKQKRGRYDQERRQRAIKSGTCVQCHKRPARENRTTCQGCADSTGASRKLKQDPKKTRNQQANTEDEQDRRSPAERKADIQQQRTLSYQEQKAAGICRDCDEPTVNDTIMCETHLARMRQYRKNYKEKKKAEAKEAEAKAK